MLSRCAGPCYRRCACSTTVLTLATYSVLKIVTALLYLYRTRDLGTLFSDSLTEDQKLLLQDSRKKRSHVYWSSFALSCLVAFVLERRLLPGRAGTIAK